MLDTKSNTRSAVEKYISASSTEQVQARQCPKIGIGKILL